MKRKAVMLRLPEAHYAQLKVAAKAYRAPSVNWFCSEMFACMMNPDRWPEFQTRLMSGAQQLTLSLAGQSGAQGAPSTATRSKGRGTPVRRKRGRRG